MTALFATCLFLALLFSGAIAFSSTRGRRPLKWMLLLTLAGSWATLGNAVAQILHRTGSTLVTPGGIRQPHLLEPATREGMMLAASLGGPALLVTLLGLLALKATRPRRKDAPPG